MEMIKIIKINNKRKRKIHKMTRIKIFQNKSQINKTKYQKKNRVKKNHRIKN
jgi:hypothetical protein